LGAKNVSQAPIFGQEAFKIMRWMDTQQDLEDIVSKNHRVAMAGVHKFNGRYLLDGGFSWAALMAYTRSFFIHPLIALQEWHRIIFAILSILGLGRLRELYYQLKKKRIPVSISEIGIENIHNIYD
jgi:hypothetical protein